jgi:ADP-ribosylglycohydrolase
VSAALHALDRFRGCLLGGAVGDALGAPVEFMTLAQIRERFGAEGITGMAEGAWPRGAITDDTQMTLFTAALIDRAVHGLLLSYCTSRDVVQGRVDNGGYAAGRVWVAELPDAG